MHDNRLSRLEELFSAVQTLRVGVIGDPGSMPAGEPGETSLEGTYLSGASGVAAGLVSLGVVNVQLLTILDDERLSDLLIESLNARGIGVSGVLKEAAGRSGPSEKAEEELMRFLDAAVPQLDTLIVCDDRADVITPRIQDALNGYAQFSPALRMVVRSRERIGQFRGMVRLPDEKEAVAWLMPGRAPEQVRLDDFAESALHPQIDCGCPLVILRGSQGSLVIDGGESHIVDPPVAYSRETPVSADAFLSAFSAVLAAGADAVEAVEFAHLAAAASGAQGSLPTRREILTLAGGSNAE